MSERPLVEAARAVRENAYVPYSRFKVGAALRAADGSVHVGCNVENVAYPEGTCAEAGAIAAMVAAGAKEIVELAVIADSPVPVTLATISGETRSVSVRDLLPFAFDTDQMSKI